MVELSLEERCAIVHAVAVLGVQAELSPLSRDAAELSQSVRVLRDLLTRDLDEMYTPDRRSRL